MNRIGGVAVDHTEFRILARLQQNADDAQKIIADDVGVTEPTLSKKIKKLEKEGVIRRYTVDIDYALLGYSLSALTLLKERRQSNTETDTGAFLCSLREAIQIHKITGKWDFAIIWMCTDSNQLESALSRVSNHPNVEEIETTLLMRALKRDHGIALDSILSQSEAPAQKK